MDRCRVWRRIECICRRSERLRFGMRGGERLVRKVCDGERQRERRQGVTHEKGAWRRGDFRRRRVMLMCWRMTERVVRENWRERTRWRRVMQKWRIELWRCRLRRSSEERFERAEYECTGLKLRQKVKQ
mmetsp:Transcript_8443/g.15280  ORF Transcript_8443/g.15280 Transcript_8443/m.15280 type:complete len:129 (+) Transcript_8443:826-1212(+)